MSTDWVSLENSVFMRVLPRYGVGIVCKVFDQVNERHMAVVGCAHKLMHPPAIQLKEGGGGRERGREEGRERGRE